jgi:hypothetical protein
MALICTNTSGHAIAVDDVTATPAEVNVLDLSATTQNITEAGAISLGSRLASIVGPASSTYAVTLAAPTAAEAGLVKVIRMASTTATNAVTLALSNVIGVPSSHTLATFDAARESLVVIASGDRWQYLAHAGVGLSTP